MVSLCLLTGCSMQSSSDPYPYTPADFKKPLKELLQQIEQYNITYNSYSGCRGDGQSRTQAQNFYDTLIKIASEKELYKISKCTNPTTRSYGILALILEREADPLPLALEHLFDSAIIFDDYSRREWTITSFLFHHLHSIPQINKWRHKADRQKFERLLLEKRPFEEVSYWLMDPEGETDTFPGFYSIVKQMTRHLYTHSPEKAIDYYYGFNAVNRLATYQRKEDIPLLDTLFEIGIRNGNGHFFPAYAIQHFPAEEFEHFYLDTSNLSWRKQFLFLRSEHYLPYYYDRDGGLRDFITLVIDHKSLKSVRLLEKILENSPYNWWGDGGLDGIKFKTKELYWHIARGIRENPSPIYDDLIQKTEKYFRQEYYTIIRD